MKKLIIIICSLALAVSCSNLDDKNSSGGQNPLNECVLPSIVQAGDEALIQWNGFTANDKIFLVSESGEEIEVAVEVFTASGIMFVVPANLPAGSYIVAVEQNGRKELGTIEIIAADMPVTGIIVPSSAVIDEEFIIEGIGFEDGCAIILIGEDGKKYTVNANLVSSGISAMLPEDFVPGCYELYLQQNGLSWLIAASFSVYGGKAEKQLKRIDYYAPYIGDSKIKQSWEIAQEEPVTLTLSEYMIEGSEETLQAYDLYEAGDDLHFELAHDGFNSSNDLSMSYTRDSYGNVVSSDVLIYGKEQTTAFTWTYNAEGYLTDISSPARSFRSMAYTDGNLTEFRNTSFDYGAKQKVNHPSAPDVVWAYMSLMESNDPFVYFPYLLGWYRKSSQQLPEAIIVPSQTGTGTVRNELSYTFDEEGYVIKMAWESSEIHFIY